MVSLLTPLCLNPSTGSTYPFVLSKLIQGNMNRKRREEDTIIDWILNTIPIPLFTKKKGGSVEGMVVALITIFTVPCCYCYCRLMEFKLRCGIKDPRFEENTIVD